MAEEKKEGGKGGMTVREAGRKGGQKVRDERGHGFYEEIGRKGGETVRDTRGHEFYEEIGHKGGQKVRGARIGGAPVRWRGAVEQRPRRGERKAHRPIEVESACAR